MKYQYLLSLSALLCLLAGCGERPTVRPVDPLLTSEGKSFYQKQTLLGEVGLRIRSSTPLQFDPVFDRQVALQNPFLTHRDRVERLSQVRDSASALAKKMGGHPYYEAVSDLCQRRIIWERAEQKGEPDAGFSEALEKVKRLREIAEKAGLSTHVNLGSGRVTLEPETLPAPLLPSVKAYHQELVSLLKRYGTQFSSERLLTEAALIQARLQ